MTYTKEELFKKATTFTFNALPEDVKIEASESYKFDVHVRLNDEGKWLVSYFNHNYDKDLNDQYENRPDEITEEFIDKFRFTLEEAIEVAERLSRSDEVRVGPFNAEAYAKWWRENKDK